VNAKLIRLGKNGFKLTPTKEDEQTIVLQAKTKEERDAWYSSLNGIINANRGSDRILSTY
jgi:hypothetical protein